MHITGGWSKLPHLVTAVMAEMSWPELVCTLLLIRETIGWQRRQARLTSADFIQRTPVKSRATVIAALKEVEARGLFQRTAQRSVWRIGALLLDEEDGDGPPAESARPSESSLSEPASPNSAGNSLIIKPSCLIIEQDPLIFKGNSLIIEQDPLIFKGNSSIIEQDPSLFKGNSSIIEQDPLIFKGNSLTIEQDPLIFKGNSSISEQNGPANGDQAAPDRSTTDQLCAPQRSAADQKVPPQRSAPDHFLYSKEKKAPAGPERGGERKETTPRSAIPRPRSAKQRALANHPAVIIWLELELKWPGWERLKVITRRLGAQPNRAALAKAREMWLMAGYREDNIGGILDWYDQLCADPHWKPYTRPDRASAADDIHGPRDATMTMLLRMRKEMQEAEGIYDDSSPWDAIVAEQQERGLWPVLP